MPPILPDIRQRNLVPIHLGSVTTFALLPLYYRLSVQSPPPLGFPDLYVSYFVLLLPLLWSVGWWLGLGLPGFDALRRDPVRRLFALALLGLALWGFASQMWAFRRLDHPEVGQTAALQLGIVALFVVVLLCSRPPLAWIIGALVIGLVGHSLITILQMVAQSSLGLSWLDELRFDIDRPGVSILQASGQTIVRPYGFMPHPNLLGGSLLAGWLAAATWLLHDDARRRWLGTLGVMLGFGALLLTFSRGAWLGLAAAGFTLLPLLRVDLRRPVVRRQLALAFVGLIAVGVVFLALYHPFVIARAGGGGEAVETRSIADRVVFLDFAYRSISERPLLGVGIGNFPWRASAYIRETFYDLRGDNVHHVLLSAWAELGIVGYSLTVIGLVAGVEAALRGLRSGRATAAERAARLGLLGMTLALTVIGLIDHYPWTILHFQVIWWGGLALASTPLPHRQGDEPAYDTPQ